MIVKQVNSTETNYARITGIIYSAETVNLCTSQAIRFPNVALHLPVQINSETDVFRSWTIRQLVKNLEQQASVSSTFSGLHSYKVYFLVLTIRSNIAATIFS